MKTPLPNPGFIAYLRFLQFILILMFPGDISAIVLSAALSACAFPSKGFKGANCGGRRGGRRRPEVSAEDKRMLQEWSVLAVCKQGTLLPERFCSNVPDVGTIDHL